MTFSGLYQSSIVGLGLLLTTTATMTAVLIVVLEPLLRRYALARPNFRTSHSKATPQGGGIAIVTAVLVTSLFAIFSKLDAVASWQSIEMVGAAVVLIGIVGAIDDIQNLGAMIRLFFQTVCVGLVIASLPVDVRIIPDLPFALERGGLLAGGLWFVNLVNFMDGLDWMIVAMIIPSVSALVLAGGIGAIPPEVLIIAVSLGGAILGFAPFNRPIARLFLGDVGSLPIGLLLGWMLCLLAAAGHFAAAVLLPLYYCADATITLCMRLLRGDSITTAHRTHFYQRATDNGFTVGGVVGRVFAVNICLAVLAAITMVYPTRAVQIGTLLVGIGAVGGLLYRFTRAHRSTPGPRRR